MSLMVSVDVKHHVYLLQIKMGSDESHFNGFIPCEGQSYKTVLITLEEKGEGIESSLPKSSGSENQKLTLLICALVSVASV